MNQNYNRNSNRNGGIPLIVAGIIGAATLLYGGYKTYQASQNPEVTSAAKKAIAAALGYDSHAPVQAKEDKNEYRSLQYKVHNDSVRVGGEAKKGSKISTPFKEDYTLEDTVNTTSTVNEVTNGSVCVEGSLGENCEINTGVYRQPVKVEPKPVESAAPSNVTLNGTLNLHFNSEAPKARQTPPPGVIPEGD